MAEKPEDLNLPNSVIVKIIKEALPDGVNVSKDARLAMSKAASVFVLYATSCANNLAMEHKRKTMSAPDVLEAMKEMEFERFVPPLEKCLEAYKRDVASKKAAAKERKEAAAQPMEVSSNADQGQAKEAGGDVVEIIDEDT